MKNNLVAGSEDRQIKYLSDTHEGKKHDKKICDEVVEQVIAGVKRCRIVKEVFRNIRPGYADTVMELACGLHNFSSYCRLEAY